jgi:hypothetical protein
MRFKDAVESITEISNSFQNGLAALGSNSGKIEPGNNRLINGSVDLDNSLKKLYPNANRWDYIVYRNRSFWGLWIRGRLMK